MPTIKRLKKIAMWNRKKREEHRKQLVQSKYENNEPREELKEKK